MRLRNTSVVANALWLNRVRSRRLIAVLFSLLISLGLYGQETTLILKNGMAIGPGERGYVSMVSKHSSNTVAKEGVAARPIAFIDDGLRYTFVNQNLIQTEGARAAPLQRIETGNASLKAGDGHPRIQAVLGALTVTPFDPFGRRVYVLNTATDPAEVIQGITELSAAYVRVEGLNSKQPYEWDMRLALNAVPPDRLREILINHADPANPQSWLNIVALYSDARRYLEAREFLEKSIQKFPELENQRPKLKQFDQLHANQMFEEVSLRAKAGQVRLAESLLRGFPLERLSLETKIKIETRLNEIVEYQNRIASTREFLRQDAAAISNPEEKIKLEPILQEIDSKLSVNNLVWLADYLRLRDDATMTSDQRVAMAISGWLLGTGQSGDNLPVMISAWEARDLVRQYLQVDSAAARQSLLDRLKAMEGGNPRIVAKMLGQLDPPLPLPEMPLKPGRYVLEVPNSKDSLGLVASYTLQLPPEYDPQRRYPCVVTLHGPFAKPGDQLDWWTGPYNADFEMCIGEASRHGYIVIAPQWAAAKQPQYNFTEDEHARVLRSLRDAMRRTSIDSDRVFLSGHQMGGDATWDMALAHPDIWAGAVLIGAYNEKYATQYSSNGRYLPFYFVVGSIEGNPPPLSDKYTGDQLDLMLKSSRYDCMLTVYQGRGRDHFQEELPRIFEWMNLSSHRRRPPPDEIDVSTARACDRIFWWLEIDELTGDNISNPYAFKRERSKVDANRMPVTENGIRVSSFSGKSCTLWLNPDIVDFSKKVKFSVKGKSKNLDLLPDLQTILEDVRTRADRQHPYWAKVEF
jgi:pimeloyl-ACP methyl ester carboxylesterase/tetratricopeptide (TPR) repeat protein